MARTSEKRLVTKAWLLGKEFAFILSRLCRACARGMDASMRAARQGVLRSRGDDDIAQSDVSQVGAADPPDCRRRPMPPSRRRWPAPQAVSFSQVPEAASERNELLDDLGILARYAGMGRFALDGVPKTSLLGDGVVAVRHLSRLKRFESGSFFSFRFFFCRGHAVGTPRACTGLLVPDDACNSGVGCL